MAWRRYRRRSWRPRYRRRYRRRGTRRFINGSSRSVIRAKIPYQFQTSVVIPNTAQLSNVATVVHPWLMLPASALYRAFAHLYDEVKLIGWKVALSSPGQMGQAQLQTLTGFKFITGIDRRFCYTGDPVPTLAELKEYASSKSVEVVFNSVAKFARSCYASDLIEKAQWHDSEVVAGAGGGYADQAYAAAGANCNFFSPAMFLGCESAVVNVSGSAITVILAVDITFYVALRNPKYGGSAAKVLSNRIDDDRPNDPPDDDDDLDHDDMDKEDAPDVPDLDKAPSEKRVRVVTADDPAPNLDAPPREPVTSTFRSAASTAARSAQSAARRELSRAADNLARRAGQAIGSKAVSLGTGALSAAVAAAAEAYRNASRNGGEGNPLPFEPEFEDTSGHLNASTGPLPSVDNATSKETPQQPTHAAI